MRATKGDRVKLILIAVLLLMGVGYAYLTTNLNINGTANVKKATWDVHFENINVTEGSVTTVTQAPTINADLISINYAITLNEPGDFYEFTVDVKNSGTIDAMIGTVNSTINGVSPGELPVYLNYSATYSDDIEIEENHLLAAGDKETYKIRLEYNANISPSDLPQTNQVYNINFSPTIIQKDSNSKPINHMLQVGDYFSLTPDSNSYTISSADSGYTGDFVITPSELKLWRVIGINNDMSIDAVSEYVSAMGVCFRGTIGYANYVNTMKNIAQQYNNSEYTKGARMFGFDNQTLIISDTHYFNGSTNNSPAMFKTPSPTSGVGEEYEGGLLGDTLYLKDYLLVSNVYKALSPSSVYGTNGLISYSIADNTAVEYLISARYYHDENAQSFGYSIRYIDTNGYLQSRTIRYYSRNDRTWVDSCRAYGFRPIITLKSNVRTDGGKGTKSNPYILTKN